MKPDVSKLRTFGCRVLVKDPDTKGKFTIRTWDGINMGPVQGGDDYKIYDPSIRRMSVTRDVHFLEGRAKPELICSPLLERQQDPIPDMDDSSEAGSDKPNEPVLPTITLSPLPQRRSTRQQGARGPAPAQSPILQSGDRAQGGQSSLRASTA